MEKEILTRRQRQVLDLIKRYAVSHGAPPTIRELREELKLKSLRGVTVHLDALVRKGMIERSRQARGIRVIQGGLRFHDDTAFPETHPIDTVEIPVVGRIAAGQPILAEQNIEERLSVDRRWVTAPGCFAVRVHGQSMVGAGIMNGDYVIIRPQPSAENGEVVAVLIDGEATVKKFFKERGGRIRLQPENPAVEPIFVHPRNQSIRILGKVVGLFRSI